MEAGKEQGLDLRPAAQGGDVKPGDMLFVRGGWGEEFLKLSAEERAKVGGREHILGPEDPTRYAGLEQSDEMLDWLHDCYWTAAAGDSVTFECWPTEKEYYLHENLLALWGSKSCPLLCGRVLDVERLLADLT